jgi:hypothetical protein
LRVKWMIFHSQEQAFQKTIFDEKPYSQFLPAEILTPIWEF